MVSKYIAGESDTSAKQISTLLVTKQLKNVTLKIIYIHLTGIFPMKYFLPGKTSE
jgi:hypothetical protein